MPARTVGDIAGVLYGLANMLLSTSLPLVLVAANNGESIGGGATPTTILGAFITVSVGAFTLLGWTLKRLLEINNEQAKGHRAEVEGLAKEVQSLKEANIKLEGVVNLCLRDLHPEPRRVQP